MPRFWGNIEAKIDAKGRVFIPAVFRKQLDTAGSGVLMLRKDIFSNCLCLYPETVWNEELEHLQQHMNRWNEKDRLVLRQFVSDLELLSTDASGRILIPRRYLQLCHIVHNVRFIGMDRYIEIWAKEEADKPFMEASKFGQMMQHLTTKPPESP